MTHSQVEDEADEDLQRYWDLWGVTHKEQERFGSCVLIATGATAIIIVVVLFTVWLAR